MPTLPNHAAVRAARSCEAPVSGAGEPFACGGKRPNGDRCRTLLGVVKGNQRRDLWLTAQATAPDRGIGWWWIECRTCRHRRRWWGRIHA